MHASLLLALSICTVALQPPLCSRRNVRRKAGEDDSVPQPDPIYSDEAVVALCMNALGCNDEPIPDAGLRTCWNFSSDMCRAAVGGSLADFLKYARNPTFAQLVDHESWSGKLGNRIKPEFTPHSRCDLSPRHRFVRDLSWKPKYFQNRFLRETRLKDQSLTAAPATAAIKPEPQPKNRP